MIARLIDEYNHIRLHAAPGYLEPRVMHYGNPEQRRQQRREILDQARRPAITISGPEKRSKLT